MISVLFFGLSFWQATAALLLGTALGSVTHGILHTNWPGLTALLAGIAVSVPLFSNQEKYVGWVPERWPAFGDVTCLVGFAVSAGLYAVLRGRGGR